MHSLHTDPRDAGTSRQPNKINNFNFLELQLSIRLTFSGMAFVYGNMEYEYQEVSFLRDTAIIFQLLLFYCFMFLVCGFRSYGSWTGMVIKQKSLKLLDIVFRISISAVYYVLLLTLCHLNYCQCRRANLWINPTNDWPTNCALNSPVNVTSNQRTLTDNWNWIGASRLTAHVELLIQLQTDLQNFNFEDTLKKSMHFLSKI